MFKVQVAIAQLQPEAYHVQVQERVLHSLSTISPACMLLHVYSGQDTKTSIASWPAEVMHKTS